MPNSDPVDIHVGARLRLGRTLISAAQSDLAEALGLTFQQVQKYERGQNRISASKLHKASLFLKRPIDWFFEGLPEAAGDEPDPARGVIEQLVKSRAGLAVAAGFVDLSSAQQTTLAAFIHELRNADP